MKSLSKLTKKIINETIGKTDIQQLPNTINQAYRKALEYDYITKDLEMDDDLFKSIIIIKELTEQFQENRDLYAIFNYMKQNLERFSPILGTHNKIWENIETYMKSKLGQEFAL